MDIKRFENGITVAELKAILSEWPETHGDGTPCEVWLSDVSGCTNQAREICPLDARKLEGNAVTADFLLGHDG